MNLDLMLMFLFGYIFNGLITEYLIKYLHVLDLDACSVGTLSREGRKNKKDLAYLTSVTSSLTELKKAKIVGFHVSTVVVNPLNNKILFTISTDYY